MSDSDATTNALMRLGASAAEAIAQVLEMFAPGDVERGQVTIHGEAIEAFADLPDGAISASVSYVDGVSGANIFVLSPAGVQKLAEAMGVPPEEGISEVSELAMSAIAEAANQMMAAAASAIGVVLGQEIEISVPDTRPVEDPADAVTRFGSTPHACSTSFVIGGESYRLIQLIPSAFVVRIVRALEDTEDERVEEGELEGLAELPEPAPRSLGLVDALSEVKLRVWAELGRTKLPLGQAMGLAMGSVVELDRPSDAPVDLFVNGVKFAQGRLVTTDDGEWALCLDDVGGRAAAERAISGLEVAATPEQQQGAPA